MRSERAKTVYMCGVDWQEDLRHANYGVRFYPSVKALKKERECWIECGIVAATVTLNRWVLAQDFGRLEMPKPSLGVSTRPKRNATTQRKAKRGRK